MFSSSDEFLKILQDWLNNNAGYDEVKYFYDSE